MAAVAPTGCKGAEGEEDDTESSKSLTEDKKVVFPVRHGQRQRAGQSTGSAVVSGWAGGDPATWVGALPRYKKHMQR